MIVDTVHPVSYSIASIASVRRDKNVRQRSNRSSVDQRLAAMNGQSETEATCVNCAGHLTAAITGHYVVIAHVAAGLQLRLCILQLTMLYEPYYY